MRLAIIVIIGLLCFSSSCQKEDINYGYGDFRLDLATVSLSSSMRCYRLDNQMLLFPNDSVPSRFLNNSRVLLNYNVISQTDSIRRKIKVISVSEVNTSTIKPLVSGLADEPVGLESAWLSGDWLNLRVSFQYMSAKHSMALYQNNSVVNDTIYLEFRHFANGDKPGYTVRTLLSYSLKQYARNGAPVPVKLRINSSNYGVYRAVYNYVSPTPN